MLSTDLDVVLLKNPLDPQVVHSSHAHCFHCMLEQKFMSWTGPSATHWRGLGATTLH